MSVENAESKISILFNGWRPRGKRIVESERLLIAEFGAKYCPRCKEVKLYDNYYQNNLVKDGYSKYCKKCSNLNKRDSDAKLRRKIRDAKNNENSSYDHLDGYVPAKLVLDEKKAVSVYLKKVKPLAQMKYKQRASAGNYI